MKPECSEYAGKIARNLLGDLAAEERQVLEAHLAVCPQCQSEQESYSRTLELMQSLGDEPVPRHFLVQPEERSLDPWQLFRMLKPGWQAAAAVIAGMFLMASLAGVLGFTRGRVDVAALRSDFLKAAEEQSLRTRESLLHEVRAEILRSRTDLTQRQKVELTAALDRVDSRVTGRLKLAEARAREEARKMAIDVYRTVSQQRAQDLSLINLRFDGIELKSAMETRQNDAILSTLLQVADLSLK